MPFEASTCTGPLWAAPEYALSSSPAATITDRLFMGSPSLYRIFYTLIRWIGTGGPMKNTLSRREILYCAGGLLAVPSARAQTVSPVMTRLSTFMSDAAGHAL